MLKFSRRFASTVQLIKQGELPAAATRVASQ